MTEKLIVLGAVVQLVIVSGCTAMRTDARNLIRRYSSLGPAGVDRSPWAPVESSKRRFTRDQGDERRASGRRPGAQRVTAGEFEGLGG